jgi:hypothetical protein
MKEDILEQMATDWLQDKGYFTISNVRFRPLPTDADYSPKLDRVHSDIDVLAVHPTVGGVDRVVVVSCKSWQDGFDPRWELDALAGDRIVGGRIAWARFRELWIPKWALALRREVEARTGATEFVYYTAVTKLVGSVNAWENCERFHKTLGVPVRVITLSEMVDSILVGLTQTLAPSDLGRTLQLLKAAGILGAGRKAETSSLLPAPEDRRDIKPPEHSVALQRS